MSPTTSVIWLSIARPGLDRPLGPPRTREFWQTTGRSISRCNLAFSILAEHLGFAFWVRRVTQAAFRRMPTGYDVRRQPTVQKSLRVPFST